MPYTEFQCSSGGSNFNAGTLNGSGQLASINPTFTYTGGVWSSGNNRFQKVGINPLTDGVLPGQFASLYVTTGTYPATRYIARITGVFSSGIGLSPTIRYTGPGPFLASTGDITCNIGGAWEGPSGTSLFPFSLIGGALVNTDTNIVRINMRNDKNYGVTTGIVSAAAGPLVIAGYSNTYGDSGVATISGYPLSSNTNSYALFTSSTANRDISNLRFINNGRFLTLSSVILGGGGQVVRNCIVSGAAGNGFDSAATSTTFERCVAVDCNRSNTATKGGFFGSVATFKNCISYAHKSGVNCHGFCNTLVADNCIAAFCSGNGFLLITAENLSNCDSFRNAQHGYQLTTNNFLKNCNAIQNSKFGVYGAAQVLAELYNCGFGSGTYYNVSGTIGYISTAVRLQSIVTEFNTIIYPSSVSPYVSGDIGNFTMNIPLIIQSGSNVFIAAAPEFSGTIGHMGVGAGVTGVYGGSVSVGGLLIPGGFTGGLRG